MDKGAILEAVYHAAGCDADDWLEGSEKNVHRFDGGKHALLKASQDVQALVQGVQAKLRSGELDNLEAAQVADFAILQIQRAVDSLTNSARHMGNMQLAAQGEISAYKKVVSYFKAKHENQVQLRKRVEAAVLAGEVDVSEDGELMSKPGATRLPGVRPEPGLAARRKAEEAAAEESSEEELAAKPKKRRVRKKKE